MCVRIARLCLLACMSDFCSLSSGYLAHESLDWATVSQYNQTGDFNSFQGTDGKFLCLLSSPDFVFLRSFTFAHELCSFFGWCLFSEHELHHASVQVHD